MPKANKIALNILPCLIKYTPCFWASSILVLGCCWSVDVLFFFSLLNKTWYSFSLFLFSASYLSAVLATFRILFSASLRLRSSGSDANGPLLIACLLTVSAVIQGPYSIGQKVVLEHKFVHLPPLLLLRAIVGSEVHDSSSSWGAEFRLSANPCKSNERPIF